MVDFAGWLLLQTPTIKGDDGAFLLALLFLLTTFIGFGILGIAYLVTGSLDVNDHSDRGQAKT